MVMAHVPQPCHWGVVSSACHKREAKKDERKIEIREMAVEV